MAEAPAAAGREGRFLVVALGPDSFAIEAGVVRELLRPPVLTRMPGAPVALAGLANLRGRALPVLDLHRLVAPAAGPAGEPGRVVVAQVGEPVGLLVDRVIAFMDGEPQRDETAPYLRLPEGARARILDLADLIGRAFPRRAGPVARPAPAPERRLGLAQEPERVALLTVMVGGRTYALALEEVAEVLALPDDVVPVPLADATSLGVIPWRGTVLPLLSFAGLLGLGRLAVPKGARIVLVRVGPRKAGPGAVGLVVDRLGSILRAAPGAIEPVPAALRRTAASAVEAICRVDGGGLVSVLSMARLLPGDDGDGPDTTATSTGDAPDPRDDAATEPVVVLDLGGERYGLPVAAIREVRRVPEAMTPLPRASALIAGAINLRGEALAVIDQRRLFGLPPGGPDPRRRIVVLAPGGADAGLPVAGFLVDGAARLLRLPVRSIRPASDLTGPAGGALGRVAALADGRLLPLIDAAALVDGVRDSLVGAAAECSPAAWEPAA